jgi:hypothetical protein
MSNDAYDKVSLQGFTVNKRTAAFFEKAQERLQGDPDWDVYQGSYNSSVGASGGTHDGGGALDVSPHNWKNRVRALRAEGGWAWHRPELFIDGRRIWGEHIHVIVAGDKEMSDAARSQGAQYKAHTDGLTSHSPDNFPYHPDDVVFDYPAYLKEKAQIRARAARARKALSNAIKSLIRVRKNVDDPQRKADIQRTIESLRNH